MNSERESLTASVRFTPPEVQGLPEVTEVAIYPDRLEVFSRNCWLTFPFAGFARRQEPRLAALFKRLTRRHPFPRIVGVREFCTDRRFVGFNTSPRLKIYTPPDPPDTYSDTYIYRINHVLRTGGYATLDRS